MILDNFALFVRIVEKGGLAAAGRELGLSPSTVSERLAAMEAHYGAALLVRSTRALRPTSEGYLLAEGARRLLADVDELRSSIRFGSQMLAGPIRISAPQDLGRVRIAPIINAFLSEHPAVSVDLDLTDGYVDLVERGMDFAIRYGALSDSRLRAKSLGDNHRVICAAPAYLRANGAPQHPRELVDHECILMRFGRDVDQIWPLVVDGKASKLAVRGRRVVNDGGLVRKWCIEGHGIARISIRDVEDDLASGTLVELLKDFSGGKIGFQIVYPPCAAQPKRVRMLIDKIAEHFSK